MNQAQASPQRVRPMAPVRRCTTRRLYKFLLAIFLFHTLVELVANGTGILAQVQQFLVSVFWVPADWIGGPLPLHQKIVYQVVTFCQALPFWDVLWWLCGLPSLAILAAVFLVPRLYRALSRRTLHYAPPRTHYRNARAGRLTPPAPSLRCRWITSARLRRLRRESLPQTEALCRRAAQACLVQAMSQNGIATPFHLFQDLAVYPHWSLGKKLAGLVSPAYRTLTITRDRDGRVGCFLGSRPFAALEDGTYWLWENGQRELVLQRQPPAAVLGAVVQIQVSHYGKETMTV